MSTKPTIGSGNAMLTATEHADHLARYERLLTVLVTAQTERSKRDNIVETATGPELAWVVYERETVWRAVNDERSQLGFGPILLSDVERAETTAAGPRRLHSQVRSPRRRTRAPSPRGPAMTATQVDAYHCGDCDSYLLDPEGPVYECSRCGGTQVE